ncbi:hypothetical protein ACP4OV_005209 [Aristida adscensionis]
MADPVVEPSGGGRRTAAAPSLRVEDWARLGIEDLPRDVVLRVVSRLGARQLVRTCAVSPRWRDLWRDVPRLNANAPRVRGRERRRLRRAQPAVQEVFQPPAAPTGLSEFRLEYSIGPQLIRDCAEANMWIGHALLCNARTVEVFAWGDRLELGTAVFTSQRLTRLHFDSAALRKGFFRQLQTGCHALERLSLKNCAINDGEISSRTLKVLSIGAECFFVPEDRVSISTPSLIRLGFFDGGLYRQIPLLKNMQSLETAYISVGRVESIQVDDIRQFLRGLSGVRKLDFYYVGLEVNMEKNLLWCPKFYNLQSLTLSEWCLHAGFYGLIVFLQNSPNLVDLTLKLQGSPEYGLTGELRDRSFTCRHLNIVQIICTKPNPVVDSLEKFLLGSGITSGQIRIKCKK